MFGFGDPNIYQPRAPANPRLLKALATSAHSAEPAVRLGLYDALMNSVLLVSTCDAPATKTLTLIEDDHGTALCAFTDLAALHRWQPGGNAFLSLPTPQLLREGFPTTATGIWINIADRAARFVSRAELAQITSGLICPTYAEQVEKDLAPAHQTFAPRPPGTLPTDLVAAVIASAAHEPDVSQAFLMEIEPTPKPARLCLGLRLVRVLEDAQLDALLRRMARAINRDASRGRAIDVVVLDFKKHGAVIAAMPPIYERGV